MEQNKKYPDQYGTQPQEDSLEGIRIASEVIRTVGAIAARGLDNIRPEGLDSQHDKTPHDVATTPEHRKQVYNQWRGFNSFVEALPTQRVPGTDQYAYEGIQATNLEDLRLAEATVWWLRAPRSMSYGGQYIPAYCVGQRFIEANEKQSDSLISMLLVPVKGSGWDGGLVEATVSGVELERSEQLSIERLAELVDTPKKVAGYKQPSGSVYKPLSPYILYSPASPKGAHFSKIRVMNEEPNLELHSVPGREGAHKRFIKKLDEKLTNKGLGVGHVKRVGIDQEALEAYGVNEHTFRLAALFGVEDKQRELMTTLAKREN